MGLYSELFYDGDLKAMVNTDDSEEIKLLHKLSRILPNNGERDENAGVIFFGVKGRNERCADSPSWYNVEEADSVSCLALPIIADKI